MYAHRERRPSQFALLELGGGSFCDPGAAPSPRSRKPPRSRRPRCGAATAPAPMTAVSKASAPVAKYRHRLGGDGPWDRRPWPYPIIGLRSGLAVWPHRNFQLGDSGSSSATTAISSQDKRRGPPGTEESRRKAWKPVPNKRADYEKRPPRKSRRARPETRSPRSRCVRWPVPVLSSMSLPQTRLTRSILL